MGSPPRPWLALGVARVGEPLPRDTFDSQLRVGQQHQRLTTKGHKSGSREFCMIDMARGFMGNRLWHRRPRNRDTLSTSRFLKSSWILPQTPPSHFKRRWTPSLIHPATNTADTAPTPPRRPILSILSSGPSPLWAQPHVLSILARPFLHKTA